MYKVWLTQIDDCVRWRRTRPETEEVQNIRIFLLYTPSLSLTVHPPGDRISFNFTPKEKKIPDGRGKETRRTKINCSYLPF